jgi:1-aminocyclopropane-1-carboxylate deaminase
LSHPLGGFGFANWAFEVAEQERQLGLFFDSVIVCTVTGSTQARHPGWPYRRFAKLAEIDKRCRRVPGIDGSATPEETWHSRLASPGRHRAGLVSLASWATPRSCSTIATTPVPTACPMIGR